MRLRFRDAFPVVVATGAMAVILSPAAGADTTLITPTIPSCVGTGGSSVLGGPGPADHGGGGGGHGGR